MLQIFQKQNKFIQHKFNKGEKRLTDHDLVPNGFIEEINEVLQKGGCFNAFPIGIFVIHPFTKKAFYMAPT